MRFAWLLTYTLIACTTQPTDPRVGTEDESLGYITETIFVPMCGTAECHSTFKRAYGYVLDSVAGAQTTLATANLITCVGADGTTYDPCDDNVPGNDDPANLKNPAPLTALTTLSEALGSGSAAPVRMPYDQPLPNRDVQFIEQWIIDGANGYVGANPAGN